MQACLHGGCGEACLLRVDPAAGEGVEGERVAIRRLRHLGNDLTHLAHGAVGGRGWEGFGDLAQVRVAAHVTAPGDVAHADAAIAEVVQLRPARETCLCQG